MKLLRRALFAVLLLLAQTGVLTHAVEHLRDDIDSAAGHACTLCIALQGLDASLASTPAMPVLAVADHARPCCASFLSSSPAAVPARARAPPAA